MAFTCQQCILRASTVALLTLFFSVHDSFSFVVPRKIINNHGGSVKGGGVSPLLFPPSNINRHQRFSFTTSEKEYRNNNGVGADESSPTSGGKNSTESSSFTSTSTPTSSDTSASEALEALKQQVIAQSFVNRASSKEVTIAKPDMESDQNGSPSSASASRPLMGLPDFEQDDLLKAVHNFEKYHTQDQHYFFGTTEQELATMTLVAAKYMAKVEELQQRERNVSRKISQLTSVAKAIRQETSLATQDQEKSQYELSQAMLKMNELEYQLNVSQTKSTKLQDKLDVTQERLSTYQERDFNVTQKVLKLEAVAQTLREDRALRETSIVAQQKSKEDLAKALKRIHDLEHQLNSNATDTDSSTVVSPQDDDPATTALKQTLEETSEVIETFQKREKDLGTKVSELESVAKTIRNDTMLDFSSSSSSYSPPSDGRPRASNLPVEDSTNVESVSQKKLQEALTKVVTLEQELNMTATTKFELQETLDETRHALEEASSKLALLEEEKAAMDNTQECTESSSSRTKDGSNSSQGTQLSMALEKLSSLKHDASKFAELEYQVWELQQQNQDLTKNNTRLATNAQLASQQEELLSKQLQDMQSALDIASQEKSSAQSSAADSALKFVLREEQLESRVEAARQDQSSALSTLEAFQSRLSEALERVQSLENELEQAKEEAEQKKQEAEEEKRKQKEKEEKEREARMKQDQEREARAKQLEKKAAEAISKGREAFFIGRGDTSSNNNGGNSVDTEFLIDEEEKLKIFSRQMQLEKEKWEAQRAEQEQLFAKQKEQLDLQRLQQQEERMRQETLLKRMQIERQEFISEQGRLEESIKEEKLKLKQQQLDQEKQKEAHEHEKQQIEHERQQWNLEEQERRSAIQEEAQKFQQKIEQEERQILQQQEELKRQNELKAQEQQRQETIAKEKAQLEEQQRMQKEQDEKQRQLAMEKEKSKLEQQKRLEEQKMQRQETIAKEKARLEEKKKQRLEKIAKEKAEFKEQQRMQKEQVEKKRQLAMQKEKARLEQQRRLQEEKEAKKRRVIKEKEAKLLERKEEKLAAQILARQKRTEQQQQASIDIEGSSSSFIEEFFDPSEDNDVEAVDPRSLIDQLKEATEIMNFLKPIPVAELHDWSINEYGEVSGTVQKHASIDDGEAIRTSPLKFPRLAKAQKIVVTETGSRYRLCKPFVSEEEKKEVQIENKETTVAPIEPAVQNSQDKQKSVSSSLPSKKTAPTVKNQQKKLTIDRKISRSPSKSIKKVETIDGLRLTGESIGDGKYLLAGKPMRGNKLEHRSEIWTAYRADEDGQPMGEAVAVKLSSRHEAIKREYSNYQRVAVSGLTRGAFVKRLEFFSAAGTSTSFQKKCALVMEMGKNDLKGHVHQHGKLEGKQLKDAATAVVQSLQAVHAAGMVWTDLKAENFIVFETDQGGYQYKGIDLESAIQVNGNPVDYTPEACPPEFAEAFLKGESLEFKLQKTYDTWSLGMLLYEISTGHGYFDGKSNTQITQMLKDRTYAFDLDGIEDRRFKDLITQCLHPDPKRRPSVTQVMMHPYFVLSGVGPFRFK